MFDRMMRVAKLDKAVYAEVEADQTATTQAATVVAIVAAASAVGGAIGALIGGGGESVILGVIVAILAAVIGSFLGWLVWSAVTYFVGTSLFGGEADLGEMLRVIGFAQVPQVLGFFSFIPCVGTLVAFAGSLISIYTGFLAVQEGLDLDTGKTIATVVIGWVVAFIVNMIIAAILALIFGVGAVGVGALSSAFGGG